MKPASPFPPRRSRRPVTHRVAPCVAWRESTSTSRSISLVWFVTAMLVAVVVLLLATMAPVQAQPPQSELAPSELAPSELAPNPLIPNEPALNPPLENSPDAPGAGDDVEAATDDMLAEELTRGVVHEAYAQPVVFNPEAGDVVAEAPPEPIEELPPEEKPEGDNVRWIPGYWTWDDEEQHYVWVSGLWRVIPPGLEWVPGYWAEASGGYQWVSGFWRAEDADDVEYLPQPPVSIERGPAIDPPTADHVWVPGTWIWMQTRYAWRPGHWVGCRPGWVWVPARYTWTPYGYVYCDGYWDYALPRRGVLYAPLWFPSGHVVARRYRHSPRVVIDVNVFASHLFCRPTRGVYCFGDYYADAHFRRGIYPAHAYHMSRYGYDPVYAYRRWENSRREPDWHDHVRADYRYRRDHEDARPPHTAHAALQLLATRPTVDTRNLVLSTSLDKIAARPDAAFRVEKVTRERRESLAEEARRFHEVQAQRREIELRNARELNQELVRGRSQRPRDELGEPRTSEGPSTRELTNRGENAERASRKVKLPTTRLPTTRLPTTKMARQADADVAGSVERPATRDVGVEDRPARETTSGERRTPREIGPGKSTRQLPPEFTPPPRPEVPRPEVPRPEVPRPEVPRPEVPRPEVSRPEARVPESPKAVSRALEDAQRRVREQQEAARKRIEALQPGTPKTPVRESTRDSTREQDRARDSTREPIRGVPPSVPRSAPREPVERPKRETPAVERPRTERPPIERPPVERPQTERSRTERSGAERPVIERPASERPASDRRAVERPRVERPARERPDMNRGNGERRESKSDRKS